MKTLQLLNYKHQVLHFLKGNISAQEYLDAIQLLNKINTALEASKGQTTTINTMEVA